MGKLVINHNLVTPEKAEALMQLCPFGAISYGNEKLDISSGCKMCKMCVRKGQGLVDFVEEVQETTSPSGGASASMPTAPAAISTGSPSS